MKLVKMSDRGQIVGGIAIALVLISIFSLFIFVMINGKRWEREAEEAKEATLDSYRRVADLAEEIPELRGEIARFKEDGVLTVGEVKAINGKADQIRKNKELDRIN